MFPQLCITGGNAVVVLYPFSSKLPSEFVFQSRKWTLTIIEPPLDLHLCSEYFGNPFFIVPSVAYLVVRSDSASFFSVSAKVTRFYSGLVWGFYVHLTLKQEPVQIYSAQILVLNFPAFWFCTLLNWALCLFLSSPFF